MSRTERGAPIFAAANVSVPRDHLVRWQKPKARPEWMARADYEVFPAELIVREVSVDGRVLVTTMLDPRRACKRELEKLYKRRWNIELDLRNIKNTLGQEALSCKTPTMCETELWSTCSPTI